MEPREEALDLVKNPLPPQILPADRVIPTSIVTIDNAIENLSAQIFTLQEKRAELLSRALNLKIMSDENYVIQKVVVKGDRVADPELLRKRHPDKFLEYVKTRIAIIKNDGAVKMAKNIDSVEKSIHLGTADKIFGKNAVTACSAIPISYDYEIVEKEEP